MDFGGGKVVCPICHRQLTNPPARIELPDGSKNILVHPACAKKGLTDQQIQAAKEGRPIR